MSAKDELLAQLKEAQATVTVILRNIDAFDEAPENNVFESVEKASEVLEETLLDKARNACEGSYHYGLESYFREFIVDGVHYIATLTPEYNRHDKTYYYVDDSKFEVKPK